MPIDETNLVLMPKSQHNKLIKSYVPTHNKYL